MALPTTWSGIDGDPSYPAVRYQLWSYFIKRGTVRIPDSDEFPALSNGELVALARAWKREAMRTGTMWPIANDLILGGLGWHQSGDRFVMSAEHMKAAAAPELVRLFWLGTDELAQQLQDLGVSGALAVDWSKKQYQEAAKDAWALLQVEAPNTPTPLPPKRPPQVPPGAPPVPFDPPLPSSGSGLGWLVFVLLIVLGLSKKG